MYAKNATGLLHSAFTNLNRYQVAASSVGVATGAFGTSSTFMQGAWDDDPNKFERLGHGLGEAANEASFIGIGLGFEAQHLNSLGTTKGAFIGGPKGGTYRELTKGGWEAVGPASKHGSTIVAEDMKNILKNKGNFAVNVRGNSPFKGGMMSRVPRLGGTYKPINFMNPKLIAAQVLFAIGAPMVLGFAGKVLDQAYSEQKHFRKPHYDNRFFDTRQYDMSSYQQLGSAMDNYENRMMSVARIFHARG